MLKLGTLTLSLTGAEMPRKAGNDRPVSLAQRIQGYAAHVYTASGIAFAFLAAREIISESCDPRWVFGWLLAAVLVDATDGPLARRLEVGRTAPSIDGRTIDDLLDYLTFVFLPLLLVERMAWLPPGWGWTVVLAMGASLLGFAHVNAKFDEAGFFRGFPSYWNIFALYGGWISTVSSPWITAVLMWVLTVLTVSPIRLLYPNRAPQPWRGPILIGGILWAVIVLAMLPSYPHPPWWLAAISLVYPAFYIVASATADVQARSAVRRSAS
jgi:phosphatidylcholine synthase